MTETFHKPPKVEPSVDQLTRLEIIRQALPPIFARIEDLDGFDEPGHRICIDLEWDYDKRTDEIIGITTIGVGNEFGVVQLYWRTFTDAEKKRIRRKLAEIVAARPVVYHNAMADIKVLRKFGFTGVAPEDHFCLDDTMLADGVLFCEEDHDLGDLCRRGGKLPYHKDLKDVDPIVYNAADVVETCFVWDWLAEHLAGDPGAAGIYRNLNLPFLSLQLEGEEAGIATDPFVAIRLHEKFTEKIDQAVDMAAAWTGWPINPRSPDQMLIQLYNVEGLPLQRKRGPGTQPATADKDAIARLRRMYGTEWDADEEPTLESALANVDLGGHGLLEARYLMMAAQQARSHYVEACLYMDPKGEHVIGARDRIYPECRQHVQASGRHSYVGPAVQQFKGEIETLIVPDDGTVWVKWDWSQIEVRVLAVSANDQVYLDAFARGEDIHGINVRGVFGPAGSPELEELRRRWIKAFVFRLHYRGLPENAGDIPGTNLLGLDKDRLIAASRAYLEVHPALEPYWKEIEREADATGMVRTFMGRPRRLTSEYRNARLREACNHPMQGGVADIYVETALLVKRAAPYARLVYGAHDAQTWQVPEERGAEFMLLAMPIVQREFAINGHRVSFPAEFKLRAA